MRSRAGAIRRIICAQAAAVMEVSSLYPARVVLGHATVPTRLRDARGAEGGAMHLLEGRSEALGGWIREELDFVGDLRRGHTDAAVARGQEWLCLHGQNIAIDGDFGEATELAVRFFQADQGLAATGVLDGETHTALVAPMVRALTWRPPTADDFGDVMLSYARAHLAEHPREIGGENKGPWVRLYMDGRDGRDWFWCAGFVCFCMRQAAETLEVGSPITGSVSCDAMARQAKEVGRFVPERAASNATVTPGAFFLSRKAATDWTHVGIVTKAADTTFRTIEGNTNDAGDRNGYEVCARIRGYGSKDFIAI